MDGVERSETRPLRPWGARSGLCCDLTSSIVPHGTAFRPGAEARASLPSLPSLRLDLDTGLGKLIVGQQLTRACVVVSITQDGSSRAGQAGVASRTLGGKAMRAALNSGPI